MNTENNLNDNDIIELEEQRKGRNKSTTVNKKYINSSAYKKKFDAISNSIELSRLLYQIAKTCLIHRSGTQIEDMYWVDLDTISIVAEETEQTVEKRVIYSTATNRKVKRYKNLLTLHNHPDSFPPSIEDFNSNYDHNYTIGIVIGHNGSVYMYSADEKVNANYYKLLVEEYIKKGYNEDEAQINALEEIKEHFQIYFREVTDI